MAKGDFLFTPTKGEVLELFQTRDGSAPVPMLRLPESAPAGTPLAGLETRLVSDGKELRLSVSEPITKQGDATKTAGAAVLTTTVDLEPVRRRLAELTTQATLEGLGAPLVVVGTAPAAGDTRVTLPIKLAPEVHAGAVALAVAVVTPAAAQVKQPQTFKLAGYGLWVLGALLLVIYVMGLLRVRSQR
ncbi:MAG: hypothetical protein H0X17_03825 [Deltaproteobacteria bacterium]|nr:hypothetical protein [Deltaproteobacteria bacterium]